jgi:hypothetical protein
LELGNALKLNVLVAEEGV